MKTMLTLQRAENPLLGEKIYNVITREQTLSIIPVDKLKQSIKSGTMYTIRNDGQNIGFIEIFRFNLSWLGIFSFYIKKHYPKHRLPIPGRNNFDQLNFLR